MNHGSGLNKRLSNPEGDDHMTKKRKKGYVDLGKQTSGLDAQLSDKELVKDRSLMRTSKLRQEGEDAEYTKMSTLPPFQQLVDPNDSDMEAQSTKSDVSKSVFLGVFFVFCFFWGDGWGLLVLSL